MVGLKDLAGAARYFSLFAQKIQKKMPSEKCRTAELMKELNQLTLTHAPAVYDTTLRLCHQAAWLVFVICLLLASCHTDSLTSCDYLKWGAMLVAGGYLGGVFGHQAI